MERPSPVPPNLRVVVAGHGQRPEHQLAEGREHLTGDLAGLVGVEVDEPRLEARRVAKENIACLVGDVDDVLEPRRRRPAGLRVAEEHRHDRRYLHEARLIAEDLVPDPVHVAPDLDHRERLHVALVLDQHVEERPMARYLCRQEKVGVEAAQMGVDEAVLLQLEGAPIDERHERGWQDRLEQPRRVVPLRERVFDKPVVGLSPRFLLRGLLRLRHAPDHPGSTDLTQGLAGAHRERAKASRGIRPVLDKDLIGGSGEGPLPGSDRRNPPLPKLVVRRTRPHARMR
jgi:hypothetical protein